MSCQQRVRAPPSRTIPLHLIGTPAEIVDKANAFREAGVTHLLGLYFAANSVQELIDQMQIFGEEVMPKIK